MALQKGEAEAGEIFRESPEHLHDYTILKGVNSYAALGGYYLANETAVPEELYEYMDLDGWAAAMRTSTPACSSAVIMCATLRRQGSYHGNAVADHILTTPAARIRTAPGPYSRTGKSGTSFALI